MLFSPGNGGSGPPKILLTRNNVVPLYENQHHVHLQYFVHGRGPGARPLAGIGQGQIYPFPEKRGLRPHYVEPHPLPGDCRATYLLAAGARGGNSGLSAPGRGVVRRIRNDRERPFRRTGAPFRHADEGDRRVVTGLWRSSSGLTHLNRIMYKKATLFTLLILFCSVQLLGADFTSRIDLLKGEKWWGVFIAGGRPMPFDAPFQKIDLSQGRGQKTPFISA